MPTICDSCPLRLAGSTGFAPVDGTLTHGILIVGEALGEEEALVSRPFVGSSGRLLDRILNRTIDPQGGQALRREDFGVTNVIWCRPPNNILTGASYEFPAIEHCAPNLEGALAELKPKAIIALGNQALRRLTGYWGIEKLRGYIFDTQWGPVVPTYHPAYIMRGKFSYIRVVQQDIKKALYVARHGIPKLEKHYILNPSPMAVEEYANKYNGELLAFDIETPHSSMLKDEEVDPDVERANEDDPSYTIIRISFSYAPGTAITFPWIPPYIDYAKALLSKAKELVVWNRNFDVPRLEASGVIFGGPIHDGMDAWHFLEPGFPMGLKFAATFACPDMPPWKLQSKSNPEWYSAADSDVLLRVFNGTLAALQAAGKLDIYTKHFFRLSKVLDKMSSRGILVDGEKRKAAREDFEKRQIEVVANIQPLVPTELKPKKVYKISEERLKKEGKWIEGKMISVVRMEPPPKPKKEKPPKTPKPTPSTPKPPRSPRVTGVRKRKRSTPSLENEKLMEDSPCTLPIPV